MRLLALVGGAVVVLCWQELLGGVISAVEN